MEGQKTMTQTLYDKLWARHAVHVDEDGTTLLYVDRHLLNEVMSPQAFEGLRIHDRKVWRIASNLAVADHNIPTTERTVGIDDPVSRLQVETLTNNCGEFAIPEIGMTDQRHGIVHVIGPEQGVTLPGLSVVCGDSHTSTHGAFACLAFGIGTSEVEHVLATQCLLGKKSKNLRVTFDGKLPAGVTAKDMALTMIGKIGTAGATGYAIEYVGDAVSALSMEGRMTLCNLTVEAGARCGMIAVDDKTISYLQGRPQAPAGEQWERAVTFWRTLKSDVDAVFDQVVKIDVSQIKPQVTWGTSPEMVTTVDGMVPDPAQEPDLVKRAGIEHALAYMGLAPGTPITDIHVDVVFIGSCTNSRIEDLRAAAAIVHGRQIAHNVQLAMVVPGSGLVKQQAEVEGLDAIFKEAGFEWREPGCSMCLGMNADQLQPGQRSASTSNRNFEGRQGAGGRTHLVSPEMAAAAAIMGHFVDIRDWR
jgi:3-isopropylmalate/(R)-2-methylmalate dehydratase large subunit